MDKINISVHVYKWSQNRRRTFLKRLAKEGIIKFVGRNKTHFNYEILTKEAFDEYIYRNRESEGRSNKNFPRKISGTSEDVLLPETVEELLL